MKLTAEQKRDNDWTILRTLLHAHIATPGKYAVLEKMPGMCFYPESKLKAAELFKKVKQVSRHTKHKWVWFTRTGIQSIDERCTLCGETRNRPLTKTEIRAAKAEFFPRPEDSVHRVFHRFCKLFMKTNKKTDVESWKYSGYEFMQKAECWAKRYPNDVYMSYTDDDWYMTSLVLYIVHKSKDKEHKRGDYHGTTIIPISQCGTPPVRTFLYPSHHNQMIDTLLEIRKKVRYMEGWR